MRSLSLKTSFIAYNDAGRDHHHVLNSPAITLFILTPHIRKRSAYR
jgi:hypothetical protein